MVPNLEFHNWYCKFWDILHLHLTNHFLKSILKHVQFKFTTQLFIFNAFQISRKHLYKSAQAAHFSNQVQLNST